MFRRPRLVPPLALAVALYGAAAGCGRSRQQNVAAGDVRTVQQAAATAAPTSQAAPTGEAGPVSAVEAARRAKVRRLGELIEKASGPIDRADALEKIGQLGPGAIELAPTVMRFCDDPDPLVRSFAVKTRAQLGGPEAPTRIAKSAADPVEEVRVAAAEALAFLPPPANWRQALDTVRKERSSRVQEALLAGVEHADTDDAAAGVAALLKEQMTASAAPLAVAAVKPAARLLIKRPEPAKDGADGLSAYLGRHDPDVRALVARALGRLEVRSPAVKLALAQALTDAETPVRQEAFDVLKRWSGKDFGYRPDADESVRRTAVLAFRAWAEAP